jgi:hypothetical protein
MATRLSIEEQAAISLLIAADATAEYRGGMSGVGAREAIDQQTGIFDMDDILVDNRRIGTILTSERGVL